MADLFRVIVLALSAVICSFAAGFVAIYLQGMFLPPSDGAYGMSTGSILRGPLGRMVWVPMTSIGAIIGFAVSAWTLRRVNLARAVPAVFVVTVSAAAVFSPLGLLSAFPALVAGVWTMFWFRDRARTDIKYAAKSSSS